MSFCSLCRFGGVLSGEQAAAPPGPLLNVAGGAGLTLAVDAGVGIAVLPELLLAPAPVPPKSRPPYCSPAELEGGDTPRRGFCAGGCGGGAAEAEAIAGAEAASAVPALCSDVELPKETLAPAEAGAAPLLPLRKEVLLPNSGGGPLEMKFALPVHCRWQKGVSIIDQRRSARLTCQETSDWWVIPLESLFSRLQHETHERQRKPHNHGCHCFCTCGLDVAVKSRPGGGETSAADAAGESLPGGEGSALPAASREAAGAAVVGGADALGVAEEEAAAAAGFDEPAAAVEGDTAVDTAVAEGVEPNALEAAVPRLVNAFTDEALAMPKAPDPEAPKLNGLAACFCGNGPAGMPKGSGAGATLIDGTVTPLWKGFAAAAAVPLVDMLAAEDAPLPAEDAAGAELAAAAARAPKVIGATAAVEGATPKACVADDAACCWPKTGVGAVVGAACIAAALAGDRGQV